MPHPLPLPASWQLNPVIGYYDPLKLADRKFWGQSEEATIGWLRESEIKHGRIAMFGFIGFIIHENGIRSPDGIANTVPTDLSAAAVWDAIPEIAKWQIVLFVGLMDIWRESKVPLEGDGEKHCAAACHTPSSAKQPRRSPTAAPTPPPHLRRRARRHEGREGRLLPHLQDAAASRAL